MYTLNGKIKVLKDEQVVSDKFKKREFVVTDDSSQYPQDVLFQLTQDRCDLLNSFSVGSPVTVHFNIRGREWTSPTGEVKYFVSLDVWRLEADNNTAPAEGDAGASFIEAEGSDDLPF